MNPKHLRTTAIVLNDVYRIAYTIMLLYWLFKQRERPPMNRTLH